MSEKKCMRVFSNNAADPHNIPTIRAKNITKVRSFMCRSRHITKRSKYSLSESFMFENLYIF